MSELFLDSGDLHKNCGNTEATLLQTIYQTKKKEGSEEAGTLYWLLSKPHTRMCMLDFPPCFGGEKKTKKKQKKCMEIVGVAYPFATSHHFCLVSFFVKTWFVSVSTPEDELH